MPDSVFTYISDAILKFSAANSGFFLDTGLRLFRAVLLIVLFLFLADMAFHGLDRERGKKLIFMILLASVCMTYYTTPAPFAGQSFSGLITDEASYLSERLEAGQDQALQMRLNEVFVNAESPGLRTLFSPASIYYFSVVALIAVMRAALIFVVGIGFIAVAILKILGPMFIPWMIFPGLEFLFWGWFKSLMGYALYQVVAAAMVNIIATTMIEFFNAAIAGPLTLGSLETQIIELSAILLVGIFGLFKVPAIASGIVSGQSGVGLWRL